MLVFLTQSRGSLYRGLVLPFSVFVLAASLVLAAYISYWSQRDALKQLEQMAATNAKFIDELQLPRSEGLADKLSTVLGVEVGFYRDGAETAGFADLRSPNRFRQLLGDVGEKVSGAYHFDGQEVAVASLDGRQVKLVLIRESRSVMATGLGDSILIPALGLAIACGFLALLLAHRIVKPLTVLTDWLPNLERDDKAAPGVPSMVAERTDEIGKLARSLEESHQRLLEEQRRRRQSERMATLGRIATSLAHEIRNPASSISLHADLLAKHSNISDSESIRLIRTEVDRITDLVNQWLFVVRPAPPQTDAHDLVALVARIADTLRTAMDHAGATLQVVEPAERLTVNCDHARIEQVVRNLLVNAMQAMPEGGAVRVSFASTREKVVLTIHDSGGGFSEEGLKRFGEPFFSEREGGMGIGLTLAHEVIAAHGGTIEGTNAPEGGAIVRVQLSLANSTQRIDP